MGVVLFFCLFGYVMDLWCFFYLKLFFCINNLFLFLFVYLLVCVVVLWVLLDFISVYIFCYSDWDVLSYDDGVDVIVVV